MRFHLPVVGLAVSTAALSPAATLADVVAGVVVGEGFDVTSYRLALTPDIAGGTLAGLETISLRATSAGLEQLVFSGNALTIDSASLDGIALMPVQQDGNLVLALPRPLAQGQRARLELRYHGRPARGFARSDEALYTSYFSCDWMVCAQDRFGDKAAFTLALRVPEGMDSLSAGRRVSSRAAPGGGEVHVWRTSRPYPAYLFGFAIGRFARASEQAGSARLTYLSDIAGGSELRRRFAPTPAMVRFLSDKAGLPLPAGEYRQLLVRGGEAQEAATYSVIGIENLPEQTNGPSAVDPGQDWAIVHELAHQWWGNLVTSDSITDFWLNEGITTFMTAAWKEHRYGRAAYDAELDLARARLQRARDTGFDKPLAWPGKYPALGLRRAVQYSKGALFMDHLRTEMGEKAFWRGLRGYTRKNAGRAVTSRDLEIAMETAAGRDLGPLFREWVYGS